MIYLDNAATSYPKPKRVLEEVAYTITARGGNPGRSGHPLSLAAAEVIYSTREKVARFIGASEEEAIVFTLNATHALNTILRARVQQGSHVIISDLEHNSVRRPVLQLAKEGIATYSIFSHTGDIPKNLDACLRRGDNILVCTHISNVSGCVLPLDTISRWCQENKVYFILDASQSIGHIPLDVSRILCDALCAPGHKGLLGIQGGGILYIRNIEGLRQVFSGGSGVDSLSPTMPEYLPDRYEAGTLPTPAIASIGAGIDFINAYGLDAINAREMALVERLWQGLAGVENVEIFSPKGAHLLSFRIKGYGSEEVAARLAEMGICVRGGHHCAPLAHQTMGTTEGGLVRVSPSVFTTQEDIDTFLTCIGKI